MYPAERVKVKKKESTGLHVTETTKINYIKYRVKPMCG
jgi:hypothetical protein